MALVQKSIFGDNVLTDLHIPSSNKSKLRQPKGNEEWYTPPWIIEIARKTMGGIDLDPASCAQAQEVVQATKYYTREDDGLSQEWCGRIFINPPFTTKIVNKFADRLLGAIESGEVSQAVWLSDNGTDSMWWHGLAGKCSGIYFIRQRVKFWGPDGAITAGWMRGQCLMYFGINANEFIFNCKESNQEGSIFCAS